MFNVGSIWESTVRSLRTASNPPFPSPPNFFIFLSLCVFVCASVCRFLFGCFISSLLFFLSIIFKKNSPPLLLVRLSMYGLVVGGRGMLLVFF